MHIEQFRAICIALPDVTEEFPFGPDTLVYKVRGKLFALTNISTFASINVKCDPEKAVELREEFAAVQPGYHMNKKHWNTILIDGTVSDRLIESWIHDSYALVSGIAGKKRQG